MKIVCAWCSKEMGTVKADVCSEGMTSHGICLDCLENLKAQKATSLQRYIDSLPLPIIVVDSNVRITAVNRTISGMLGKTPDTIVQHLGGEVFECAHARLPGGCGKTIHCSGCAIRRTVTRCFETGKPQIRIPAYLNPDGPMALTLLITAVKTGDVIVLRVDRTE
jgi:hypothetical protein